MPITVEPLPNEERQITVPLAEDARPTAKGVARHREGLRVPQEDGACLAHRVLSVLVAHRCAGRGVADASHQLRERGTGLGGENGAGVAEVVPGSGPRDPLDHLTLEAHHKQHEPGFCHREPATFAVHPCSCHPCQVAKDPSSASLSETDGPDAAEWSVFADIKRQMME
jgi:hypothetical protein